MSETAEKPLDTPSAPDRSAGIDPAGMRVIWLLLAAAFVAILNETTMAIAIPSLNHTLGIPPELGQWLTSAFMLTMAVVIPTTGFLLQRFTTRQVFLAAIGSFVLGTAICLVAPGFSLLLVGRIVQAAGTGVMMPLLMTTMMNVVPPNSRGRMMGRVGLVMSLAPALGPTLSGVVLDHLGWRWLFGIILPIAVVALALGAKWMTNLGETTSAPIDVLSIVLSALAFGGIVYGLSQLGGHGGAGGGALPWTVIASGLVFLALFVWRQLVLQKKNDALLDLRVFTSRNYVVAVIIMGVVALSMFGTFSLLPLYLQDVAGLEPTAAGLVLLPGSILMGLLGPVMGRIYDARGPKTLLVPGTILIAVSMFVYSTVGTDTPTWFLMIVQILMSLGLAGSFTPLFSASLGSLDRSLYSHGSAALNTLQQVGGAAGTAVLISIYSVFLHTGEAKGVPTAVAGEPGAHAAFFVAACIAVVPVVLAFFIRKPADQEPGAGGH
ncbi:MDR family MFS transporter [Leucobacter ruminantium]|uniref:Multidrug efflux MFS transporter n=1 Tax=Leucobacter ruminantium TaxID=1289170 RepID=A0A939RT68_9MICO|nr:MDR family MFS transporter [Leucobacter ruminantium]MBO1803720.1 multidrug efflux MFS transporter [Leucobacter ruminantium]